MIYILVVLSFTGAWEFRNVFPDRQSCEQVRSAYLGSRDSTAAAFCTTEDVAIMNGYKPKKRTP
jgi:hypothetical protein